MRDVYQEMIYRPGFAEGNDLIEGVLDEHNRTFERAGSWGLTIERLDRDRELREAEPENIYLIEKPSFDLDVLEQLHVIAGLAKVYCRPTGIIYNIPYYGSVHVGNEDPILPTPVIQIGDVALDGGYVDSFEYIDPFYLGYVR